MHIEDLKTWHWVILGLVAGALFSGVKLWQGPWFENSPVDTIDQRSFENGLLAVNSPRLTAQYRGDEPVLKDVVVHPPIAGDRARTYWVTGKACTVAMGPKEPGNVNSEVVPVEKWLPFKYDAKTPYVPLPAAALQARRGRAGALAAAIAKATASTQPAGANSQYPTVVDYLKAVQTRSDAKFSFRYAWQELPVVTAILPPVAGLLMIGIAWPMTLRVMQGAGLARKPQPRVKLPKNRKTLAAKGPLDNSAGDKQLAELTAALEAEMAGFVGANLTTDPDESRVGMPAIKSLAGASAAIDQKQGDNEVEVKDYGGIFYPVVRSTHKEPKPPADEPDQTPAATKK